MTIETHESLYQQDTDFEIIQLLLPFIKNKNFLDIGAEKGTFTEFMASHGFIGNFYEPLPAFEEELKAIANKTHCKFYQFAIDSKDGSADFYTAYDHTDNPMAYFSTMHPLSNDERITHKKTTTVVCRSLDSLLAEDLISKKVGVLKIDTEGNDLNVLNGMSHVEAEVLMCEYFMPGVYSGWELGHPLGLIERAKQLGFNNFMAIKRIDEFELVSINNSGFIDKQWGNLIFISDNIFNKAQEKINEFVKMKEAKLLNEVLNVTRNLKHSNDEKHQEITTLKHTCEERLILIEDLKAICDDRLKLINQFHEAAQKEKERPPQVGYIKQKLHNILALIK